MDAGDHSAVDISLETWRRVQDANLTSVFLSCKYGIPRLRDTVPVGSSVINAPSFLAAIGSATAPMAYAAAKAGVIQLTRDLGVHLARSGVRVNAVLFGPIETPAQRAVFDRNPGALDKRLVHRPMGRFGTLEEAPAARGGRILHRCRCRFRRPRGRQTEHHDQSEVDLLIESRARGHQCFELQVRQPESG
jgi:NAD(P)-dependent dehydrogenase (short-subunit alcohol dehydrogenase family)